MDLQCGCPNAAENQSVLQSGDSLSFRVGIYVSFRVGIQVENLSFRVGIRVTEVSFNEKMCVGRRGCEINNFAPRVGCPDS